MGFRWNDRNLEHVARHGVDPDDSEHVVATANQPYPLARADEKWLVWGATREGRLLQVVFVIDSRLPADITTITLSYTFFEVEGNKT